MEPKDRSIKLTEQQVADIMKRSPHLKPQSYDDIPNLTPTSPQVISRQATLNIGTIGHVAHGKSTVVKAISSVNTVRFKPEMLRNITIRLGYANAKIYRCTKCPEPECFKSFPSSKEDDMSCQKCQQKLTLLKHISFVDCPGHDILLSTMLTGAAVMDAALLLIAANMDCPQPQTSEHLVALDIVKLDNIIILQNKVDIIFKDQERAIENYKQIKQFIKDTRCMNAPIIPISAQLRYNIDAVCQSINNIPIPKRSLQVPPKMIIIRSFDVNKPGSKIQDLVGGVVGGSILEGVISIGMEVEIRPGSLWKDEKGVIKCTPIRSRVVSLLAENNQLLYAVPGGLIGVGLLLDPSITRNDKLVGSVLGAPGSLPEIYVEVGVKFYLMRKLLGVKNEGSSKQVKIQRLTQGQTLKFNVGSTQTPGQVMSIKEQIVNIKFTTPICTTIGQKVAFSRRIEKSFRLIGWGEIRSGK